MVNHSNFFFFLRSKLSKLSTLFITAGNGGGAGSRFIDTVRKALIAKVRLPNIDNNNILTSQQMQNNKKINSAHSSSVDGPLQVVSQIFTLLD